MKGLPWEQIFSWDGEPEQLEREDVVESQGSGWWEPQGAWAAEAGGVVHSCSGWL